MKRVNRLAAWLLSVLVVSSGLSAPPVQAAPGSQVVNRIAATVNGRPITASEVKARLAPYYHELMMLYPRQGPRFNSEMVKAKKAVLQELIERELVLSEFETKGYLMKEDYVDDEINRRILVQFNGRRDEFLENLRKSGMSYSEYRDSVKKEVTVASMRSSRYERGIPPTPDELRAEYNASKADYRDVTNDAIRYDKIFIPAVLDDMEETFTTPEMQYQLALNLKEKLEKGDLSFAEAARQYSRDSHAQDGGRWPMLQRKDLAVDFSNIVFSAEPGKIVGPLMDPAGFTLVRVAEKRLAPAPPLEKVKEQVDDAVRRKQSEARYRQWIERLKGKAVIREFI